MGSLDILSLSRGIVFLCFFFKVFAADCYGDIGVHPDLYYITDVALAVCDGSSCSGADTDCTLTEPIRNNTIVTGYRKLTTAGAYSECTSAIQNILSLCFNNPSQSFPKTGAGTYGNWSYNGQYYLVDYQITDQFVWDGIEEYETEIMGDQGILGESGDTDQYIFGPTKYCIGLGPGGEEGCVDVKEGCFVIAAVVNTLPTPICG